MSTEVLKPQTPIEAEAQNSVMAILRKYGANFTKVLPKHLTPGRCGMLVTNAIQQNPRLAGCTPVSFINSVLLAANMGLEIRPRSAYLVPYGKECQLLIDYRGKMDIARRAGVGAIHPELVREGDEYDYGFNSTGLIFHWKPGKERGEVFSGFVSAKVNGDHQITVMSLNEIEGIRRRAKSGAALDWEDQYHRKHKGITLEQIREKDVATMAFSDPYRLPWVTDWDRMALKSILHRAANNWPMSAELLTAQEVDVAVETGAEMPKAVGMADVMIEIDPADNRPMVDGGGDTREEQKAAAQAVGQALIEKGRKSGPTVTAQQVNQLKARSGDNMARAIHEHGYRDSAWSVIRQADYDSILARVDELDSEGAKA